MYICHHCGKDALAVVDVKAISAVISMVPDYQVTIEGDIIIPENRYSLVEAPILKLATLGGTVEEDGNAIDIR